MRCLVIGSGGREHALCWKLASSPHVREVHCAPGNGGTAHENKVINHPANAPAQWLSLAKKIAADLTIVGPEQPLAEGLVDLFQREGLRVVGPRKNAAQLESSKAFAKEMMHRAGIPTARYRRFTDAQEALTYAEQHGAPMVIKADGLASGKGVVVAHDLATATEAIRASLVDKCFGQASEVLIIEECLIGEEASFIVLTDGQTIAPLNSSQDHKRLLDGDQGPNTGGMGAYSPAPIIDDRLRDKVLSQVMEPLLHTLHQTFPGNTNDPRQRLYAGFLYAGLMINPKGDPFVLEFNCRLGDPETQPLMMGLSADLALAFNDLLNGDLKPNALPALEGTTIGVVLASGGYPHNPIIGQPIEGLAQAALEPNVKIFHAGTTRNNGQIVTSGGRVLCVTAQGKDLRTARESAYRAIEQIHFDGMQWRRDIAHRAL